MKEPRRLTLKQERFIQAYIELGNGSQAVKVAGYKTNPSYLNRHAKVLMNTPAIKNTLDKIRQTMQKKHEIDRNWIITEYMRLMTSCSEKEKDIVIKAIQEITKVLGLYAPEEKINTNTNTITVKETLEELKAAREIYKKDF